MTAIPFCFSAETRKSAAAKFPMPRILRRVLAEAVGAAEYTDEIVTASVQPMVYHEWNLRPPGRVETTDILEEI